MKEFRIIFWDFDGVIKDSVEVKSAAFEQLFLPYGKEAANRVRRHHEAHAGVSRYNKIPLYLKWVGESADTQQVQRFCNRFSELVRQAVVDSAWVPGVREYLEAQSARQEFVLVTATPEKEMLDILHSLEIRNYFCEVHGAPKCKADSIGDVLLRLKCPPELALMVGDAEADLKAAEANSVVFMLRRTALNLDLQKRHAGPMLENFIHE